MVCLRLFWLVTRLWRWRDRGVDFGQVDFLAGDTDASIVVLIDLIDAEVELARVTVVRLCDSDATDVAALMGGNRSDLV